MKLERDGKKIWRAILWVTGMLILLMLAIIWYWVISFDTKDEVVDYTETDPVVYFEGYENNAATDSWDTVIQMSDDSEDVAVHTGTTCSCKIVNNNSFEIKDWLLQLEIEQECYLNGFWCGSFEVHQFRDGKELINRIESQSSDISELDIDRNEYSDTMLIHLIPGDYLIYYPSVEVAEELIKGKSFVGVGFIFYYQENLNLSNWSLTYNNNLRIFSLPMFKIVLALIVL